MLGEQHNIPLIYFYDFSQFIKVVDLKLNKFY